MTTTTDTIDPSTLSREDLVKRAMDEDKAARAAKKAGEEAPPTPCRDYLNTDEYRARKANGNGKAKAKGEGRTSPTPVERAGFITVQMVKGRQVEVVAPIASKVTDVDVEHWSMLVKPTAAQTFVDAIVEYLIAESKPYPTRMGLLTLVSLRKAFPKATSTWTAPVNLLVSALNAGVDDGSIEAWGWDVNADSTMSMWFEPKGKARITGSIRDLSDKLGVKPPAKPKATKATKASKATKAPAKAAAAKKASTPTPVTGTPTSKQVHKALNPRARKAPAKKASVPTPAKRVAKAS